MTNNYDNRFFGGFDPAALSRAVSSIRDRAEEPLYFEQTATAPIPPFVYEKVRAFFVANPSAQRVAVATSVVFLDDGMACFVVNVGECVPVPSRQVFFFDRPSDAELQTSAHA